MFNGSNSQSHSNLVVYNNFIIPEIWRIFRDNHIRASIVLPVNMYQPAEKWIFDTNMFELKDKTNRIVSSSINTVVDPLDHTDKFPFVEKVDFTQYSIKKCLDWLIANLNDDQWLADDFRGEKSKLMDSRFETGKDLFVAQRYWAHKTIAFFFAKQEDLNLFKVLKEHFKDDN